MAVTSKADNGSSTIASLTPQTTEILLHSILSYLHRNGFTKTLKRFQSEAQIQNDKWKASSVNLEDIYCKYLDAGREAEVNTVVESESKPKKKKKNKPDIVSGDEVKEAKSEAPKKSVDDTVNDLEVNESKKKPKDKKKKSQEQEVGAKENGDVDTSVVTEEKKSSKKWKNLSSDENEHHGAKEIGDVDMNVVTEDKKSSKKRKNLSSDENEQQSEKMETDQSAKKQRMGSAEPKTVNAFQRVKIDKVEFAHEKLQDNSYWAKDGADVGYGAKAQEVLGQVRGRDFRHEKTKKKRGSYRGGQIDLQSHSVKFNYSDEE